VYIPDEEFLEKQIDLIRFCPCVGNFICLQSIMKMIQIKNSAVYYEVKELIEGGYSGFYYFANEHCKDTFVVIL
jgi:YHS domain-containing protein